MSLWYCVTLSVLAIVNLLVAIASWIVFAQGSGG